MSFRLGLFAAAVAASVVAAAPASAAFNATFAGESGATTPLTITSGDNTLTFSSTAGAGVFTVANSGLYTGFGLGLGDYSSFSGDPLTISVAKAVTGLDVTFGIEDLYGASGNDVLTFTTNTGYTAMLSGTLNGAPIAEPEGTGTFSAPAFTSVTITSANPFAIGAVSSAATSVPEPMTLALVGAGLVGLVGLRRRA